MEFTYQITIRSRYRSAVHGRCLKCGCTDEYGCAGGCSWADGDHTLCTACYPGSASAPVGLFVAKEVR